MSIRIERKTECPTCGSEVVRKRSRPDAARTRKCAACKEHPQHGSAYGQAARKYNLTYEELDVLYAITHCDCCGTELKSGGGPGISSKNQRQIDHCHATGTIRGVLCWNCNVGIGKLGDSIEGVKRALNYLEKTL
jgi:hypothetical protein